MKNIKIYIIILLLSAVAVSCFEEKEFLVPDEFAWVGFEENRVLVAEESGEDVTVRFLVSSAPLSSAVTFDYSISSSDATEGVDYTLPAGSGSFTIPAGASSTDVVLIESVVNNENITGDRTIEFEVTDGKGYDIGGPDDNYDASVTVKLLEDDFTIFGYTSFEEPEGGPGVYNVPEGTDLPNHPGENPVDYVSVGEELGFDLSYTEGNAGGSDDLLLGVHGITNLDGEDIGSFYDGVQGYSFNDADGEFELVFDEITLDPDLTLLKVEIAWYFVDSSWEDSDVFTAVWRTEDGEEEVYQLTGGHGDDEVYSPSGLSMISGWTNVGGFIDNKKTGRLVLYLENNSGSEIYYIDNVVIKGF